eukprot:TRINITY_DN609_c0_g1_i1.p1 TRINITY_DN609_c0_g1~~TRINITY_DN609_c0_g1_i1.p1  ORF type:complete len:812 (+),score=152.87 TRINITY_DN609_c0_g1_i1:18-2453(+)
MLPTLMNTRKKTQNRRKSKLNESYISPNKERDIILPSVEITHNKKRSVSRTGIAIVQSPIPPSLQQDDSESMEFQTSQTHTQTNERSKMSKDTTICENSDNTLKSAASMTDQNRNKNERKKTKVVKNRRRHVREKSTSSSNLTSQKTSKKSLSRTSSSTSKSKTNAIPIKKENTKVPKFIEQNVNIKSSSSKVNPLLCSSNFHSISVGNYQELYPTYENSIAWKRRHNINGMKLFVIDDVYEPLSSVLIDLGWVRNFDLDFPYFDLKFLEKGIDIKRNPPGPKQEVNHFLNNEYLSTKEGFFKLMRSQHLYSDQNFRKFYPNSFHCFDDFDFLNFFLAFRVQLTKSILITNLLRKGEITFLANEIHVPLRSFERVSADSVHFNLFNTVLNSLSLKFLQNLAAQQHRISFDDRLHHAQLLSGFEWQVLHDDWTAYEQMFNRYSKLLNESDQNLDMIVLSKNYMEPIEEISPREYLKQLIVDNNLSLLYDLLPSLPFNVHSYEKNFEKILSTVLTHSKEILRHFTNEQNVIEGHKNIWLCKSNFLSKKPRMFSKLSEFFELFSTKDFCLIQKYVECPLLYKNYKYEILQHVLVTNLNPLTIYMTKESLVIWNSFAKFNLNVDNLNNLSSHHSEFKQHVKDQEYADFLENDSSMEFARFIFPTNIYFGHFIPQMINIIICSLKPFFERADDISNACFEIFEFKFCVDADLNVWVLDVDSNLKFKRSNVILDEFYSNLLEDVIKVLTNISKSSANTLKKLKNLDTGIWYPIYKGQKLPMTTKTTNLDDLIQTKHVRINHSNHKKSKLKKKEKLKK